MKLKEPNSKSFFETLPNVNDICGSYFFFLLLVGTGEVNSVGYDYDLYF
jgi:hypothetical protein